MAQTLHVISHTHWDREWYLTFQQFRLRLVDLVDNLLALQDRDPDFRYFNLDAQTIVLEDYLAVKPQNRARLERYIREGRITVGPWYQLNDQFLTSGESTVRSLLIGNRIAQQFGASMKIGYLPDQFGNISQMPQILRGFGIDNAILGRGYQLVDGRKMEFVWASPDGSEVTASLLAFWYNNAQHFPADPEAAVAYVENLQRLMSPNSAVSHLLLMNGVDHLEAQQDLGPILRDLSSRLKPDTNVVHSTLPDYINALKAEVADKRLSLERHVGELREDRGGAVLAGTLSSRMYLKQANHRCQTLLEKYAEPFSAFAMQSGADYPFDMLHYAWKLLMQNHPHDSICGCSIDQVHREMLPRFDQVEQIGEEFTERALRHLADKIAPSPLVGEGVGGEGATETTLLVVFNSLNWTRTDPVTTTLVFPLGAATRGNPPRDDSRQWRGFILTNENGEEIPFAVTHVEVKMRTVLSPVELPLDQWVQEYTLEFVAQDVPACGYKSYRVTPKPATPNYPALLPPQYEHPPSDLLLEDVGDVGDEYLHRKPMTDTRLTTPLSFWGRRGEQGNAVRASETVHGSLDVSQGSDAMLRSSATVPCPVRITRTHWRNLARSEYHIEVDNAARDHRLRALFTTIPFRDSVVVSEANFDVIQRPLNSPHVQEGAAPFSPQQSWIDMSGSMRGSRRESAKDTEVVQDIRTRGITIINAGLPEFEIVSHSIFDDRFDHYIAITLLRCVGYLSRRGDGPQFATPDAQCLGKHSFHLAVYRHEGDWQEAKVWQQAHQFNTPLRAVQTTVTPNDRRDLPPSLSFVTVEPDALVVTAIKRAEDTDNTLIVRFFNITEQAVENARIQVRGAQTATLVNLNEERQQELRVDADGAVTLPLVNSKQIVTLAFTLQ